MASEVRPREGVRVGGSVAVGVVSRAAPPGGVTDCWSGPGLTSGGIGVESLVLVRVRPSPGTGGSTGGRRVPAAPPGTPGYGVRVALLLPPGAIGSGVRVGPGAPAGPAWGGRSASLWGVCARLGKAEAPPIADSPGGGVPRGTPIGEVALRGGPAAGRAPDRWCGWPAQGSSGGGRGRDGDREVCPVGERSLRRRNDSGLVGVRTGCPWVLGVIVRAGASSTITRQSPSSAAGCCSRSGGSGGGVTSGLMPRDLLGAHPCCGSSPGSGHRWRKRAAWDVGPPVPPCGHPACARYDLDSLTRWRMIPAKDCRTQAHGDGMGLWQGRADHGDPEAVGPAPGGPHGTGAAPAQRSGDAPSQELEAARAVRTGASPSARKSPTESRRSHELHSWPASCFHRAGEQDTRKQSAAAPSARRRRR